MYCENNVILSWRPADDSIDGISREWQIILFFWDELLLFGEEQHVKHIIMISFLCYLISTEKREPEEQHQPSVNKRLKRRKEEKNENKNHSEKHTNSNTRNIKLNNHEED
jgi:hypothetical protein